MGEPQGRLLGLLGDAVPAPQRRGPADARAAHRLSVLRLAGATGRHPRRSTGITRGGLRGPVARDHTVVSDAQVQLLFEEFAVPQVVELLMWISFEYAGQMFGCLVVDEPATAEEKQAFAASIANA